MHERLKELKLTKRQVEVWTEFAHGYNPDEIGDRLLPNISRETVRKMIAILKTKVHLQNAQELAADYWCRLSGTTLKEQRLLIEEVSKKTVKSIQKTLNVSIVLLISIGMYSSMMKDHNQAIRNVRQRLIEYRIRRN